MEIHSEGLFDPFAVLSKKKKTSGQFVMFCQTYSQSEVALPA